MGESRYIVVEGPIGVGKTTFVNLLAEVFQAETVLERAEENPFLSKFYGDTNKFAFQTQIFFLLTRYQQQQEILQTELFRQNIISDYLFAKDRIFAYLNLSEDELVLYEWIYQLLDQRVVKPDLVIYLQAPVQVLLKRIRKRALWYEKEMDQEYLEKVSKAYNTFFFHYKDTPLLVVNTSEYRLRTPGSGPEEPDSRDPEHGERGAVYYHRPGRGSPPLRLPRNSHLRRCARPSSLRRTVYASSLHGPPAFAGACSCALHMTIIARTPHRKREGATKSRDSPLFSYVPRQNSPREVGRGASGARLVFDSLWSN